MSQDQRATARGMISKGDPSRSPAQQRDDFDAVFGALPLGDDVTLEPRSLGGVPALDVKVDGADGDGVILYLHGGGYVIGSARTGANLAAPLARRTGLPAVSLDYRLAPEAAFPAAVDDALAAYKELLEGGREIVVAGDSAGGGLALATWYWRHAGRVCRCLPRSSCSRRGPTSRCPVRAWTPGVTSTRCSAVRTWQAYVDHYLAGHDPKDELASPLLADLTGLPPLLIQVGTAEVLLDDSLRLAARAAEHEVDVSLDVVAGAPHVYQYNVGLMDEADAALTRAAAWLTQRGFGGGVA